MEDFSATPRRLLFQFACAAFSFLALLDECAAQAPTAVVPGSESRNSPEQLEEFIDLALGLFIHWSVDVEYGSVISHSLVGADDDYQRRYFNELPASFNPRDYDPSRWAELASTCGFKYAVLTAKHHNGFCLWPSETTDFTVEQSRYGKDIVGPYTEAFRDEGLKVGLYFSPEDFWMLHQQGHPIAREPAYGYTQPSQNAELREHNQKQMRELLQLYGPVDVWFFDSKEPPATLKKLVWDINPDSIVTRGALATPEQALEGAAIDQPWEACFTLGDQWQYRGANEQYKSGSEVIQLLIESRAKGGNLLLNVGPTPSGILPDEQEAILRELGLWLFVNQEAIYRVRPWKIQQEGDVWFTRAKDDSAVYAFLTNQQPWPLGERREFTLTNVELTENSEVSVLGHGGQVLEYEPTADPAVRAVRQDDGVVLSVMRAQRMYNDRKWSHPIVVRITHPKLTTSTERESP